jgi:hypothetical protein
MKEIWKIDTGCIRLVNMQVKHLITIKREL